MAASVQADVQGMLVSGSACSALRVALNYEPADPYAVTAKACGADGTTISCTAARDVFSDGLSARCGDGDVVVQPSDLAPGLLVRIVIRSERDDPTQVELSAPGLRRFLRRTFLRVPAGLEHGQLDLDSDIARLLTS